MKKLLAFMLAMLMLLSLFAGCGKKEADSAKDPASSGQSAPTGSGGKEPEAAAPVTNQIGVTRYPAADGKNNYVKPENVMFITLDKDAVHPSADATFTYGASASFSSLCNYTDLGSSYAANWIEIFYDSLVYYDSATSEIVPGLATSWEWLNDTTLRMKLREGVVSHMGDPFTASDVLYTLSWGCANPKLLTKFKNVFDMEKSRVIDDYTVDIVYQAPSPFALVDLSSSGTMGMVVEASVEKLGGIENCDGSDPSFATGPYKLVKWDKASEEIIAERNESYWAALPYYKHFNIRTAVDATARSMGVESGDFDMVYSPSSTAVIAATDNKDIATYICDCATTMRMDINTNKEPLNIKEIRQAIALSINYEAICQVGYSGYANPGNSLMPNGVAWHTDPAEGETEFYQHYDTALAKEKLKEAGYPDGFELNIMFTSGMAHIMAAIEIIQNGMSESGIAIKIEQLDSASYNDRRSKGDFYTMIGDAPNATSTSSIRQVDPRRSKWTGEAWANDEVYALIDKCYYTVDLDKCYEYVAEFQDLYRELCPSIVIASPKCYNMINGELVNMCLDSNFNPYAAFFFPAEYLEG